MVLVSEACHFISTAFSFEIEYVGPQFIACPIGWTSIDKPAEVVLSGYFQAEIEYFGITNGFINTVSCSIEGNVSLLVLLLFPSQPLVVNNGWHVLSHFEKLHVRTYPVEFADSL